MQFEGFDWIKPSLLKCATDLHRSSLNKYVDFLDDVPLFIKSLWSKFEIPITAADSEFISSWENKTAKVDIDFYNAEGMIHKACKGLERTNQCMLYILVLAKTFAAHGFHHITCATVDSLLWRAMCICTGYSTMRRPMMQYLFWAVFPTGYTNFEI